MKPLARPAAERRVAFVVVGVFLTAGCAWILFTDLLLYSFVEDRTAVARIETAKDWAFVAVAALLLYVVTLRSTAQLSKTTKTLSAIVGSIGDGVLLLGSDRRIAYANPASVQMLGATTRDDLLGMGAREFSRRFHVSFPDGRRVQPDQFAAQRVFDEAGPIRYKTVLSLPGERELVVMCTAAAVQSEGKPVDLVVSILHDITVSEHVDRHRDELLAAVAHAFKTPVTVIKSATYMLSAGAPPQAQPSVAIIERQCGRLERLIENLLVLSRIRSGTLRLYLANVDLGHMLEDVAGKVARPSTGHQVPVQLDARPQIRGDGERLAMILRNVLHAAIRESQPGTPVALRLDRCGDDALIVVSYGQWQASNVETAEMHRAAADFDDMGVSGYVTATIVEAHGGTISESTDEGGTTIQIRLPATPEGP